MKTVHGPPVEANAAAADDFQHITVHQVEHPSGDMRTLLLAGVPHPPWPPLRQWVQPGEALLFEAVIKYSRIFLAVYYIMAALPPQLL